MPQDHLDRRGPDRARFISIVVGLLIVDVALAAIQRSLGFGASSPRWTVAACGLLLGSFVVAAASGKSTAALVASPIGTPAAGTSRAALAMFGAVSAATGMLGALARRVLPDELAWPWTLVVHVPVAVVLVVGALRLLPSAVVQRAELELEAHLAMVMTSAIMLVIYGLRSAGLLGWSSSATLASLGSGAVLWIVARWLESRSRTPVEPAVELRDHPIDVTALSVPFALDGVVAHLTSAGCKGCRVTCGPVIAMCQRRTPAHAEDAIAITGEIRE